MPCVLCALDIIPAGDCVDVSRIQDVAGLTLQLMANKLNRFEGNILMSAHSFHRLRCEFEFFAYLCIGQVSHILATQKRVKGNNCALNAPFDDFIIVHSQSSYISVPSGNLK